MFGYGTLAGTVLLQLIICFATALLFGFRVIDVIAVWALIAACIQHVNVLNVVATVKASRNDRNRN